LVLMILYWHHSSRNLQAISCNAMASCMQCNGFVHEKLMNKHTSILSQAVPAKTAPSPSICTLKRASPPIFVPNCRCGWRQLNTRFTTLVILQCIFQEFWECSSYSGLSADYANPNCMGPNWPAGFHKCTKLKTTHTIVLLPSHSGFQVC